VSIVPDRAEICSSADPCAEFRAVPCGKKRRKREKKKKNRTDTTAGHKQRNSHTPETPPDLGRSYAERPDRAAPCAEQHERETPEQKKRKKKTTRGGPRHPPRRSRARGSQRPSSPVLISSPNPSFRSRQSVRVRSRETRRRKKRQNAHAAQNVCSLVSCPATVQQRLNRSGPITCQSLGSAWRRRTERRTRNTLYSRTIGSDDSRANTHHHSVLTLPPFRICLPATETLGSCITVNEYKHTTLTYNCSITILTAQR
jgi:hypothetical protein